MCESYNIQYKTNYKCLMPTNTFGPNDHYNALNSHFLPALIKKVHDLKLNNKKELTLWGNGLAKREVIYVDDIADACIFFMKKNFFGTILNIGTGKDFSIKQYAKIILNKIIPKIRSKLDMIYQNQMAHQEKFLDIKLANKYGWKPKQIRWGNNKTYKNFLENNKIA